MISLTDYILLTAVITFLGLIPKASGYLTRAWLLVAEFCAFTGLFLVMDGYDPLWFYMFSAWLATLFVIPFLLLKAPWLAGLSGVMALYHLSLGFAYFYHLDGYMDYYYPVMLVICLAQLSCILPGVIYGIRYRIYGRVLPDRRTRDRHHLAN